jgi:hypothetical protein
MTVLSLAVPPAGATGTVGGTAVENTPALLAAYRANRAAAEHEAHHLLSLARLRPGAKPLGAPPSWYPKPALPYNVTAGITIVQLAGYWSVPVNGAPGGASVPWYSPAGLALNGQEAGSGPGAVFSTGDIYWAKATVQWQSAELNFTEVDDDNTAAAVQVLAVVTWLDPRPMLDDATGPRDHLGPGQPCPAGARGVVGVSNPRAYASLLRARLLPPGPAVAGLLCIYNMESQAERLYRTVNLSGPALERWATAADTLALSHPDGLPLSCGVGFATGLLALSYPHLKAHSIDLWLDLTGCKTVANGYVTTAAGDLAELAQPYLPPSP